MPRDGSGPAAPHVLARGAVLLLLAGASATQTCAPWSVSRLGDPASSAARFLRLLRTPGGGARPRTQS